MTDWQTFWLAAIAIGVLVMAIVQVAVLVAAAKSARQAAQALGEIRQDLRTLIERLNRIAADVNRVTEVAASQMLAIDRLIVTATDRVDQTLGLVHQAVLQPLRQGTSILAAIRAGWSLFRDWQHDRQQRSRREDDEALFVG